MQTERAERTQSLTDAEHEQLLAQAAAIRRGAAGFAGRLRLERGGELSFNQSAVLALLFRFGDLTPGELASRLGRSPQSLTRVLRGLEAEHRIGRHDDPADRRQSLLTLTLEGREALGAQMRPRDRWLAGVLRERLTAAERELLVVAAGLLERLTDVPMEKAPRDAGTDAGSAPGSGDGTGDAGAVDIAARLMADAAAETAAGAAARRNGR